MNLTNCSGCGRLQPGSGSQLCAGCKQAHLELSREVKRYLQAHPGASMLELYRHTGIPIAKLQDVVKYA